MSSAVGILDIFTQMKTINSVGFSAEYIHDYERACNFLDRLIENSIADEPIFSGILIFEKRIFIDDTEKVKEEKEIYTVIDGLQRLITISLLLNAICENFISTQGKKSEITERIFEQYLTFNSDVKLFIGDGIDIFRKIIFRENLEPHLEHNLVQTHLAFVEKIKNGISPSKLLKIISQIKFLVIYTDNKNISSRELYLNLNKNKSNLTQINLISDFIMQVSPAKAYLWKKVVNDYKMQGLNSKLVDFVINFLTIQNNGKIPLTSDLYINFKIYFETMLNFQPVQNILENISKYAGNYLKILQADFNDTEIKNKIISIKEHQGQDSFPYLMEVLDDLESGHLESVAFLNILTAIDEFITKRFESGSSTSEMNFASLSKELNKQLVSNFSLNKNEEEHKLTINKINNL